MDRKLDNRGRWRNKTVAFRVSMEEDIQLETKSFMLKTNNIRLSLIDKTTISLYFQYSH